MCKQQNAERIAKNKRDWYSKNAKKRYALDEERRDTDPGYKLVTAYRHRILKVVKGHPKSAKSLELLGCTPEQFREYLEKQFQHGMTWENHGDYWHIDHIRPCASFDFTIEKK